MTGTMEQQGGIAHAAMARTPSVVTILLAMTALWTIVPALVHTAPPLDVVESGMWGREWLVGTYKHPALPAWLIEISSQLTGGHVGWAVYLVGQLCTLATIGLTFLVARDLSSARVATAAVLCLLGIEYFSWRSPELNHTQVQIPFWIASVLCAWRAVDRGSIGWWLALGASAAAGLYGKLSNAVLLVVIAVWILSSQRGRRSLATPGPWLGAVLFAVLCVPLVHWLVTSNFQALQYANARGHAQSAWATWLFPANAALQALPVGIALALAGFFGSDRSAPYDGRAGDHRAYGFLLTMAIAPPALSILLALVGHSGLRASWLAPALPLLTVLVLHRDRERLTDAVMHRLRIVGFCLAVFVPIGYAIALPSMGHLGAVPPVRVNWPKAEIAQALSAAWSASTGGKPLRIVAGPAWPAGLVALDHPDRPSIFTEGEFAYAPWITAERLTREGALIVWFDGRGGEKTPAMEQLIGNRPIHKIAVPFPRAKAGATVEIKYVILPPA